MKNITTISLPPDLKAVAKRNGSHRGIPKLSTYIQYLIAQDDHMIQNANGLSFSTVSQLMDIKCSECGYPLSMHSNASKLCRDGFHHFKPKEA